MCVCVCVCVCVCGAHCMLGACTPAQAMLHSLPQLASRAVPRAYLQSRLPASSLTQLRQRAQIAAMADVETFQLAQGKTLLLSQGDITEYDGDALVNAGKSAEHPSW